MRMVVWARMTAVTAAAVLALVPVMAQDAGKLSDEERAKRDAAKVFNFIKFQTVRVNKDKEEKKDDKKPAVATAATPAPHAVKPQTVAKAEDTTPRMRGLEPTAAGQPAETKSAGVNPAAPAVATTLPPVTEPNPAAVVAAPVTSNPVPEPEPDEPDEVPLKLVNYVAPEMNRQVLDAMGGRDHAVPVRFTVEPNGTVSQADPRPGVQRKLGQAAARAIQQWRFSPLPERRVVDVELMFRAATD